MSNSITDEYNTAMANGNAPYADYLSQIMNASHQAYGTDLNAQLGVTGITNNSPAVTAPSSGPVGDFSASDIANNPANFGAQLGSLFGANASDALGAAQTSVTNSIGNTASSVASALGFVTDIPRVATTVTGFVLFTIGALALLRAGQSENITIKESGTAKEIHHASGTAD